MSRSTAHPEDTGWVDVDYATLIGRCVHHLSDLGHRHVAPVNRSAELVAAGYGPGHRALAGFATAVAERGLHGTGVCCDDDAAAGGACIEEILATRPDVTAIAKRGGAADDVPAWRWAPQRSSCCSNASPTR